MNDTRLKMMEAIARRRIVSTRYNGDAMTLAPHQMFERHGALFVSALNLNKNWRSDEEKRLGQFKLDGLGETEVTEGQFVQAYHVIQSFARDGEGALDPNNPDDWEKAHELGRALAREVAGKTRLATVTTQIDEAQKAPTPDAKPVS